MGNFNAVAQLVLEAERLQCAISDVVAESQVQALGVSRETLYKKMQRQLAVMRESAQEGMLDQSSVSGLSGGMAMRYAQSPYSGRLLSGTAKRAVTIALAVAEHNACMGLIVAAPTAGSCGILPAVLLAIEETCHLQETAVIKALFNSAGIGMVIAGRASISGAQGGCQAECGSAAAMAASAAVEMLGGTPAMSASACALSLKFTMGLVCDPVAGLVEVPCVKRNASGAVTALTAAELALTGIISAIPADEVIDAMKEVGQLMPACLKETSMAGLAAAKTAKTIEAQLKEKQSAQRR
ncbi:MAG: L-serine ammonia-lyase, iron-sulfur-dependent, subunit alpha [Acetanaerobacterium sp.]